MSERDWPPFTNPNWRPLRDVIAFVSRHFGSVRMAETKLYAALVFRDLLSIRERADGVREPLTYWEKINFSVVVSIHSPGELDSDDDITIVLGDEWLSPYSIFVWWPDVERLCGLTAAQPEPATPAKTQPKQAAKTPRPARSTPKRAATPKQKPAKHRTKRTKQRITVKRKLVDTALNLLRDKHPEKYSEGFSKAQPAVVVSQIKPIWAKVCKAEGVSPDDYKPPKWDMVARAIGRRRD